MGRIPGSIETYAIDPSGLNPPELEAIALMVMAYPQAVPYHMGSHLSTGAWAQPMTHGGVVHDIRMKLGRGAVETVRFRGYRLGPDLLGLLTGQASSEGPSDSSEECPISKATEIPTPDDRPHTRHLRRSWQSHGLHRNRQESIHSQLLRACGQAGGL